MIILASNCSVKSFFVHEVLVANTNNAVLIVAEDGETQLQFTSKAGTTTRTLYGAGDYTEINLQSTDSYYYINSSKAVGVVQYCISSKFTIMWAQCFIIAIYSAHFLPTPSKNYEQN